MNSGPEVEHRRHGKGYRLTPSGLFVASLERPDLSVQPIGLREAVDRDGDPYGYIERQGGRRLVVHTFGNPQRDQPPIFYLHGSPGWGGGPIPRPASLFSHDMFIIAPTRPGYYESHTQKGRTFADTAADVAAIAEAMGIEKYYVVGRSGGGLHALEVLRRNGDAVLGAGVLVAPVPPDVMDESWTEGMVESNVALRSMTNQQIVEKYTKLAYLGAYENNGFRHVPPDLSERSRREIRIIGIEHMLQRSYTKAYGDGGLGWAHDVIALKQGLGDTFQQVDGRKVILFYNNREDNYVPRQHGITLHNLIPDSTLLPTNQDDAARAYEETLPMSMRSDHTYFDSHFGAFDDLFEVVNRLRLMQRR